MRIGSLEDLEKPKKSGSRQQTEDRTPAGEAETPLKTSKWKNWWYYHKWYVICCIILFGIVCDITINALGFKNKAPDFQIAYIGKTELPQDTASALKQAFASIAADYNGDGEIIVQINQYIDGIPNPDAETAYYEYASETALIGDISSCESYFFLMDDPEHFQLEFQLLASPDGNCPDNTDYSVEDKVIPWTDCSLLSDMELGTYSAVLLGKEQSGDNQDLLSPLYIGRRCFYTDTATENADACDELWNLLYHNSR